MIVLPSELIKAADLGQGDTVNLYLNEKHQIIIEKAAENSP